MSSRFPRPRGVPFPIGATVFVPTSIAGADGEPIAVEDTVAEVIARGVDCWRWHVMYEDGSPGHVLWGERDQTALPLGMPTTNGMRIVAARREVLCAQFEVRTKGGAVVKQYFALPKGSYHGEPKAVS